MTTTIKLKRSNVSGSKPTTLQDGELALNQTDGVIYFRDSQNNIRSITTDTNWNNIPGKPLVVASGDDAASARLVIGAAPTDSPTFTGLTKVTSLAETAVNMGSENTINLSTGGVFKKTITAATTLSISANAGVGAVSCFILEITNGGAFAVTWWPNIKWPGGVAPSLTAAGTDTIGFYTTDNGATWMTLGLNVKGV